MTIGGGRHFLSEEPGHHTIRKRAPFEMSSRENCDCDAEY